MVSTSCLYPKSVIFTTKNCVVLAYLYQIISLWTYYILWSLFKFLFHEFLELYVKSPAKYLRNLQLRKWISEYIPIHVDLLTRFKG